MNIAKKEIINYESIERSLKPRIGSNIQIKIPSLQIEEEIEYDNSDSLKTTIFELAERFPHRRIAVTSIMDNQTAILEIHPVTGSA
jgi:hypothetical protein